MEVTDLLSQIEREADNPELSQGVATLRRREGIQMINALVGEERARKGTGAVMKYLIDRNFLELPSRATLAELAVQDGIDPKQFPGLIEDYDNLLAGGSVSKATAQSLYTWRRRPEPKGETND